MKRYQHFISALTLIAVTSPSCAQNPDKKEANLSVAAAPQLRWQYETGG
jgi:hypothetical protein